MPGICVFFCAASKRLVNSNLFKTNRVSSLSKNCRKYNDDQRYKSAVQDNNSNVNHDHDYHQINHTNQLDHQISNQGERRFNEINIQMLSKSIHEQVFPAQTKRPNLENENSARIRNHLQQHGLWGKDCTVLNDVNFKIPKFHGKNINQHFENIAKEQIAKYLELAREIADSQPPPIPKSWLFQPGWTKYTKDGVTMQVNCPDDDVFVFDVEVCIKESELPVIATAASPNAWYCLFVYLLNLIVMFLVEF